MRGAARRCEAPRMVLEIFKRMWAGWNAAVRRIFRVQNALLMGVAYFVGIGPVAIVMRLTGRSMLDRAPADPKATTYWVPRDGKPMTMEEAGRRY